MPASGASRRPSALIALQGGVTATKTNDPNRKPRNGVLLPRCAPVPLHQVCSPRLLYRAETGQDRVRQYVGRVGQRVTDLRELSPPRGSPNRPPRTPKSYR